MRSELKQIRGIGDTMCERLGRDHGIETIADLARLSDAEVADLQQALRSATWPMAESPGGATRQGWSWANGKPSRMSRWPRSLWRPISHGNRPASHASWSTTWRAARRWRRQSPSRRSKTRSAGCRSAWSCHQRRLRHGHQPSRRRNALAWRAGTRLPGGRRGAAGCGSPAWRSTRPPIRRSTGPRVVAHRGPGCGRGRQCGRLRGPREPGGRRRAGQVPDTVPATADRLGRGGHIHLGWGNGGRPGRGQRDDPQRSGLDTRGGLPRHRLRRRPRPKHSPRLL